MPPLGERPREVVDRRTADLELQVVPRRALAVVLVVELDRLRITAVVVVVATAVAEVDAADERDVAGRIVAPHDEELLVVAAAAADPVVEQHLTARLVDAREKERFLPSPKFIARGASARAAPARCTPPLGQLREHVADRGAGPGEQLVGIALPVGEVHPVAGAALAQHLVQPGEVLGAVDQDGPSLPSVHAVPSP